MSARDLAGKFHLRPDTFSKRSTWISTIDFNCFSFTYLMFCFCRTRDFGQDVFPFLPSQNEEENSSDGKSILALACVAGHYELVEVSRLLRFYFNLIDKAERCIIYCKVSIAKFIKTTQIRFSRLVKRIC